LTYGIEELASLRLPVDAGSLERLDSHATGSGAERLRDGTDIPGCGENASGSRDAELVRGSVDPPGELDRIDARYLLDLRTADVGGSDEKGERRVGRRDEESTMNVRANVGLSLFIDSGQLIH